MSMASILRETAYVASVTSTDAHGKPIYGPPVARKVRTEQLRRMVVSASGEEAVSNHRLWCATPIALTDRIWLPGASTSSAEASNLPITVTTVSDFSGARTLCKVEL
jgi:hypothetical protein